MDAGTQDWTGLNRGESLHRRAGAGCPRQAPKSWPHLKAGISSQLTFLALAQGETLQTREVPTVSRGGLVQTVLLWQEEECVHVCIRVCLNPCAAKNTSLHPDSLNGAPLHTE